LDAEFKLNPRCISSAIWRKVLEFRNKGLGEEREDTRVIDPKGGTMISSIVVTVPTRGGVHTILSIDKLSHLIGLHPRRC